METNEQNFEQEPAGNRGEESPENSSDLAGVASGNQEDIPGEEGQDDGAERTRVPNANPGSTNGPQGDRSEDFDPQKLNEDRNGDDRNK
ncbi:hypothetical protein C7T94_09065 [Pedobacter yulinensis]|uniref:Uncharacterized protein n=1 Tax=Pedobacter yulinensis TaxID=2126353 RepID=A0A2T3HJZ4_9SPHI|nr:hypothetical protein [Pedobacter yulinensis]PST82785.1 hypothetical protein C7T94_09065 [Pedobacter yulinensis]